MRKILTRIAVAEGKGRAVEEVEGIVASSRGDIRHAILTLQLQLQGRRSSLPSFSSSSLLGGRKKKQKTKKEEEEERKERRKGQKEGEGEEEEQKDAYMSNFHAIGKVLYAKRYPLPPHEDEEGREEGEERRGKLSFVPEEVLGKCEMEVDSLSTFIQAHCVQHYGEMEELSEALELFSDSDVLLARVYSTAFVSLGRQRGREGGRACLYCAGWTLLYFILLFGQLCSLLPSLPPSLPHSNETRPTQPFLKSTSFPSSAAPWPILTATRPAVAREEEGRREGGREAEGG
jgi:hypothetical protein